MNSMEAQRAITAKTHEVIALARSLYPTYTHAAPSIRCDIRGRSVGGTARGHIALRYNLDWYAANPEEYLNNTVTHEVAHIVAAATGLGKGHNRGWVLICLALGGDGKRCNTHEDVKAVPKARRTVEHLYLTTVGTEVWVGPVHHSKLQKRGDVSMFSGREGYTLRYKATGHRVLKTGWQHKSRMKA